MASLFDPKFCDVATDAINAEARYNHEDSSYQVPTVASNYVLY